MKNKYVVIAVIIFSFLLGRYSKKTKEHIVYQKGKEVSGNVHVELPFKTTIPVNPILPMRLYFINDTVYEAVDSAKVVEEYSKKKTYSITLFDDNIYGKLSLKPSLQYNSLIDMPYTFTPIIQKHYLKDVWSFYGSGSYNTFNIAGLGGGFFYHNLGVEYKYLYQIDTRQTGHEIGLKFKF